MKEAQSYGIHALVMLVLLLSVVVVWGVNWLSDIRAEQAVLEEQRVNDSIAEVVAERDLYVVIARRSSDYVWAINRVNPDTTETGVAEDKAAKAQATKERDAWLDSLRTGKAKDTTKESGE